MNRFFVLTILSVASWLTLPAQQTTNSYFLVNGGYTNYTGDVSTSCYPILSANSEWGLGPKQLVSVGYGGRLLDMFTKFSAWSRKQTPGTYDTSNYIAIGENGNSYTPGSFFIGNSMGIGTTSPDQKLTVKGKIHAEEVIVDLAVPADYVFAKDYTLMPLHKVEQYVQTNNHLPDVPSATEIKEKGLNMGEMQNKLLQKIEELTLYAIEQNKKIEQLEQQIKQLQTHK